MTWFKSLIMRQNSPLLLIDSEDESSTQFSASQQPARPPLVGSQEKLSLNCRIDSRLNSNPANRPLKSQVRITSATNIHQSPTNQAKVEHRKQMTYKQDNIRCPHQSQVNLKRQLKTQAIASQRKSTRAERKIINNHITNSMADIMRPNLLSFFIVFATCLAGLMLVSTAVQALASSQYFEVQPDAEYLVPAGNDVRLRCLVRNRQGECMWLRNGRNIGTIKNKYQFSRSPEDGDCSLMIRNVSVQPDDGTWQCQVAAPDIDQDTMISRDVSLVVLVAPEKPQIKNMTLTSGSQQRVILEENKSRYVLCEMRGGNPSPRIEWILDNRNITKEAQIQVQPASVSSAVRITQSRLKMSDIKRTMNGKNLTCVGVHPTLNQSTVVELDVQYVPTVSVIQREYSIVEGSPLTISCQVDANPPPSIVNWRLVSDGNNPTGKSSSAISSPSKPGPTLEFERISREFNQNIFECLAQNSYGVSSPADVRLNVLYAPFLLNTSHSESVLVGSQAQLACNFDGNPEPEIRWHYTDPLSRFPAAVQLENSASNRSMQQLLTMKNVTYRNEGDYHCEAKNQINGVNYSVRSSNIILDVYGEPQFLVKSPVQSKATQGAKSDLTLTFCSDPTPNKVYWQFGSLRLDVRLNNLNGAPQVVSTGAQTPPGVFKQNSVSQRFQVHQLQSIQKRDSNFSKSPTCFEATLTIVEPELSDQRDYTLVVQNERGYQTASVRLRVTSPLSPVLMISSAFVTIFGLFLLSLLVMFLVKKRSELRRADSSNVRRNNGIHPNGNHKNGVEHLANGNGITPLSINGKQQQTRGLVNGLGNGQANGASNPTINGNQNRSPDSLMGGSSPTVSDDTKGALHMMSMASSDTSAGDQRQLLSDSGRNSNSSRGSQRQLANHGQRSTANSTPTPMNHISVEDDLDNLNGSSTCASNINVSGLSSADGTGSTYQAAESVTSDAPLSPRSAHFEHNLSTASALIYANLNYPTHNNEDSIESRSTISGYHESQQLSPRDQLDCRTLRRQQTPAVEHPNESASIGSSIASHERNLVTEPNGARNDQSPQMEQRYSVGATIAMMNSLAAAAASTTSSPGTGVLNGAINQQLANSNRQAPGVARRPGPPKPPKPSIQQRSRFYQQQAANANGLVMIGTQNPNGYTGAGQVRQPMDRYEPKEEQPTGDQLAAEYSRLAFAARAEL